MAFGVGTGLKLERSTPQTANRCFELYGSIATMGLLALPCFVTSKKVVRLTGPPVAAAAGMVASSVRDSSPSSSIRRNRGFRARFDQASGRIRPWCPRPWTFDAPVRMTMSPTVVFAFLHREDCGEDAVWAA